MKLENDAVIAVNGLTKRFGTIIAVDNVSFSVPDCDVFGFLGPNDAKKRQRSGCLLGFLRRMPVMFRLASCIL
jgi:ABC-type uncharacterized transport system, ATPase component